MSKPFLEFTPTATTDWQDWPGGEGNCAVQAADFDSSTVKLQVSYDGGVTAIDVGPDVSFSANGIGNFILPQCQLRFNVSGGTPTTPKGFVRSNRNVTEL
jgi:hypothetical protein